MRNSIYILLLITIITCQKKNLKTELENAYSISARNEKDTLNIESFEILKKQNVDFEFVQNIRINNLKHSIYLDKLVIKNCEEIIQFYKKNIINRNKMIELDNQNNEKYLKQIKYDQQKLEKTKLTIEKKENELAITHQKIVLIQAEFNQNKNEDYEIIDYVFVGEINGVKRIDTLAILRSPIYTLKYIKNDMFTNYKGK